MFNQLSVYMLSGRRAGEAANRADWSFVSNERRWLAGALSIERAESVRFAEAAAQAWSEGWALTRRASVFGDRP